MLRFLGALVVILIVVACVGLYLGWFHVGYDNTDGNPRIEVTGDKDKFKQDQDKVVKGIRNIGHSDTTTPAPSNK